MSMIADKAVRVRNCEALTIADVPRLATGDFLHRIERAVSHSGARICALFAHASGDGDRRLFAVLGHDAQGLLDLLSCDVGDSFDSITPNIPQAHLFEREIAEQFGIEPLDHPWLKPVRFGARLAGPINSHNRPAIGIADFFSVQGEQIHEVAVGPVHAGVIEPGHFRFQCHGENVFHLEISLGYQHRGVEEALIRAGQQKRHLYLMETVAGDTTIGHATAYCRALEALADVTVTTRCQAIRAIAAELERCANHAGDLGALAGDVGYLPVQSFCGRIRGDFLNMSALICGSRFGRGLLTLGGVQFDIEPRLFAVLLERLDQAAKDLDGAAELLMFEPSVLSRFEYTGLLSAEQCIDLGIVGPAARASGVIRDVRQDYPYGIYRFTQLPPVGGIRGDIYDRAMMRWREIQESVAFIRAYLENLPMGDIRVTFTPPAKDRIVVSLTEGWRGEICHVAITDAKGAITRYKIVDPSFHNWTGLAMALRGMQISDFPLCNKSFNLSYCGFDL
jgi:Ni,Fe-hydrogenase III large subunit